MKEDAKKNAKEQIHESYKDTFIEFKDSGEMQFKMGEMNVRGTYKIKDNVVHAMVDGNEQNFTFEINNKILSIDAGELTLYFSPA